MVGEHHSKDRKDIFKFGNFFSFWNIEMLFYSSSPHPIISFYIEPPYPLKIYTTINKWMARIEESLVNHHTDWVHKWNKAKNAVVCWMCWVDLELSSLMHWVWDSCKQIHSYILMLKPLFLTSSRFYIYFVDFESKLLLSLGTYKIILQNIIYT